jgi:hypothetical protein
MLVGRRARRRPIHDLAAARVRPSRTTAMKNHTLLLSALLLSPGLLLGLNPAATKVKFAPADSSTLTKTFENKATLTLDSYTMTGAGTSPEMEMTLTTKQNVTVSDEYVTVKDGAPKKLIRSFDDLAGDSSMSMKMSVMGQNHENSQNMRMKSELAGKKVVFTWNAEKSAYDKAFDPAEEKPDLLKDLAEDMDFRALLPEGDVKEGDTWNPDVTKVRYVFSPGGALALKPENADDASMKMGSDEINSLSSAMGESLEGEVKAELAGVKDVDGVSCATIHLKFKVHSATDMTEQARKMIEKGELPPGVESLEIDHLDLEFKFEGEGDLIWDVAGGHFKSFELSGESTIKSDQGMKIGVQGKTMDLTETREMSGSTNYTATAK